MVEVAGVTGLVEEVELRTIKLRDLSGNLHVVPNGIIDKVKNLTKDYSYCVIDIGVAYRENVDEVMRVLQETAEDLRRDSRFAGDILAPLEMLGVDQFKDSAVIIKCRIKTEPHKQWRVGREMNRRIRNTFDAKEIAIPFPYQPSYWGSPRKRGRNPHKLLIAVRWYSRQFDWSKTEDLGFNACVMLSGQAKRQRVQASEQEDWSQIRMAFEKAVERVRLPDFRFHDLRHTAASRLAVRGRPLKKIQKVSVRKSFSMILRCTPESDASAQGSGVPGRLDVRCSAA